MKLPFVQSKYWSQRVFKKKTAALSGECGGKKQRIYKWVSPHGYIDGAEYEACPWVFCLS